MPDYGLKDKTIAVGIVGTGYAAKKRAEAFINHPSSKLIAVVGNTNSTTNEFTTGMIYKCFCSFFGGV